MIGLNDVDLQEFKRVANAKEQYEGVVTLDFKRALSAMCKLATGVASLHATGTYHGELTDMIVLMADDGMDGGLKPVMFSQGLSSVLPPTLEHVCAVREDYILFFAPERCPTTMDATLSAPTAEADMWSFGVLLIFITLLSLPMVQVTTFEILDIALKGNTATQILEIDSIDSPQAYKDIARQCLQTDPAARPTSAHVAAALAKLL